MAAGKTVTKSVNRTPSGKFLRHNPGNWPTGGGGGGKLGDLPQFGSGADLEKQRPPAMKEEQLHTHSFSGSMIACASSGADYLVRFYQGSVQF